MVGVGALVQHAPHRSQQLIGRKRLVQDRRWKAYSEKMTDMGDAREVLGKIALTARQIAATGANLNPDGQNRSALEALQLADFDFSQLDEITPKTSKIPRVIQEQIKRDALYANYVVRQDRDIATMQRDGLSNELSSKLERIRPTTIAQAARVEGMTPAAIMLLLARIRRIEKKRSA